MDLIHCLKDKICTFRDSIAKGRPYVWELRISGDEYAALELAITQSIKNYGGSHRHLISKDYAIYLVIYFAEWYKRIYCGSETGDEAPVLSLDYEERKQLFALSGINDRVFVYNASENPDKTNLRWKESLQVLGGLAVRDELRKDESDPFLCKLCKIFHGEEIDINDVEDRGRAVAFQQSIAQGHSLYHYVEAILNNQIDDPFAQSDLADNNSPFSRFLRRIKNADKTSQRNKFDFEWLISYAAYYKQMVRRLKIRLKPESIGGKFKQYIGYHRLLDFWGISNPESIHRLMFDLRFVNGRRVVREATFEQPLLTFSNTGNEKTGFLATTDVDEIIYNHIPTEPFTAVELWLKYDEEKVKVQEDFDCSEDCLQVYKVANTERDWSSRIRPQSGTSVIFSDRYHLKDEQLCGNIVRLPFRDGTKEGEVMNWLPIYDVVTLIDEAGREYSFFNRNGYYQVVAKMYRNTIRYEDNIYVTYKYVDLDEDDCEDEKDYDYMEEKLPLLFGREGLQIRHFSNIKSEEGKLVETFDLEYLSPISGRYIDWAQHPPQQGKLRLRITVNGMALYYRVYYVPFKSSEDKPQPIWRDFQDHIIRFAIAGITDIPDEFTKGDMPEYETRTVILGEPKSKILMEIYRPYILKELYQNGKLIQYLGGDETVEVPMLTCNQFSLRDFNEQGVQEYDCGKMSEGIYLFPDFHNSNPSDAVYLSRIDADKLSRNLSIKYLKGYITKAIEHQNELVEWDYKSEPKFIKNKVSINNGIVFQSLKENKSPRHYTMPRLITGDDGWDWDDFSDDGNKMSDYDIYKHICEHKTYFFLFEPMRKAVIEGRMIVDIAIPLLIDKQGYLTDSDINNIYRFAREFHLDWMLIPRSKWIEGIKYYSSAEDDFSKIQAFVEALFIKSPKATGEQEVRAIKEMMRLYWSFDIYNTSDSIAVKGLRLILGDIDGVLNRGETWEMFLTDYDKSRHKFSEMSRIYCKTDNK